jgi:hypothetical protein
MSYYDRIMQFAFIINDFAVVIGYLFLYVAFSKFHKHAESKSGGGGGQSSVFGAFVYLFCAGALIGLPYFIKMFEFTLWGNSLPLSPTGLGNYFIEKRIVLLLRVFGVGMFVSGLVKLAKAGSDQGGQQSHLGKAIMTLVIGALLIHIVEVSQLLSTIVNSFSASGGGGAV